MSKYTKYLTAITAPLLLTTFVSGNFAHADANSELNSQNSIQEFKNDQKSVDSAMTKVISEVDRQIASGKEDINVSMYVPEIGEKVGVSFHTKDIPTKNSILSSNNNISYAVAKPSGRKSYYGNVNAWGFTHELSGDFVYSDGKVQSATREVRASGITYSHTRTSGITKLDPSVWSIHSTSVHKWLGKIGEVSGLGYTSYITVEVYGSGTSALKKATYKTGA